uniref:Vasohibin n=1 Tax=Trypanosoma congolense (strain IL3000) TaxID=1068625 RepID=G0UZ99_TRYCI|nr:conserved hypothetical protein [Trypanosoma congolense IL3000]
MYCSEKVRVLVEQLASVNPYTNAKCLPDVPRPDESTIPRGLPSRMQIPYVQNVLNALSYNFLPNTFFCLEKRRSLQSILLTSKEILTEALPIRCLEATFVGLYLTQDLKDVDRIPLSFKSRAKGRAYHHIVLVIRCDSRYGAVGLSRKSTLMDKPLMYTSLFELIMEYKKQYEAIGHELVDFKLGLCVSHKRDTNKTPCWRYISVKLSKHSVAASPAATCLLDQQSDQSANGVDISAISNSENCGGMDAVEDMLTCYCKLISRLSEEYDNRAVMHAQGLSSHRWQTCLRDLHDLDVDASREENKRRLDELRNGRSPCSAIREISKKRSASRSISKKRAVTRSGGVSSSEKVGKRPSFSAATARTSRKAHTATQNSSRQSPSRFRQHNNFMASSEYKGDGQLPVVSTVLHRSLTPEPSGPEAESDGIACTSAPTYEFTEPMVGSLLLPLLDSKTGEFSLSSHPVSERCAL